MLNRWPNLHGTMLTWLSSGQQTFLHEFDTEIRVSCTQLFIWDLLRDSLILSSGRQGWSTAPVSARAKLETSGSYIKELERGEPWILIKCSRCGTRSTRPGDSSAARSIQPPHSAKYLCWGVQLLDAPFDQSFFKLLMRHPSSCFFTSNFGVWCNWSTK